MVQGLREIDNAGGKVDVESVLHIMSIEGKVIDHPLYSIFLIPGAGNPAVESWPFYSRQWLSSMLPKQNLKFNLWAFDYHFPVDDKFTFENIWMQGEKLLKGLSECCRAASSRQVGLWV